MQPASATKQDEHAAAAGVLADIESMHRRSFARVERELAGAQRLPKFGLLLATAEKQELAKVGRFDRRARRAARVSARPIAESWATDLLNLSQGEVATQQALLDREWSLLIGNDPALVRSKVNDAFTASGLPARALHQDESVVGVVVGVPELEQMPELKPTFTRSSVASVGRLNKTERAGLHAQYVAAQVLLVAKQAVAVAPGLTAVRVVAAPSGVDVAASGAFVATTIPSAALEKADMRMKSWELLLQLDPQARFKLRGRVRELDLIKLHSDDDFGPVVNG